MEASVVIPAYNAEKTVEKQLDALGHQDWDGKWEVIVADNGSTDRTREVVKNYATRDHRVRLVDASGRPGAGHARNVGVRTASGECLLFCDADDEVGDGWLAAMVNATRHHGFVASRLEADTLSPESALKMRRCPQQSGLQTYNYPPYMPHAATAGLGVLREIHERVGGFDESFYRLEDTDYCFRIQLANVQLHFEPAALVHMRFRSTTRETCRQARGYGEYNVKLYARYRKHGMPALPLRTGLRRWRRILRHAPSALHGGDKEQWLWSLHWSLGRVVGCLKYGVLAL